MKHTNGKRNNTICVKFTKEEAELIDGERKKYNRIPSRSQIIRECVRTHLTFPWKPELILKGEKTHTARKQKEGMRHSNWGGKNGI